MEIKEYTLSLWDDFVKLIYPAYCLACEQSLVKGEETICTNCRATLPRTHFHLDPVNPVATRFYGLTPIERVLPYLHFSRKGIVQKLLHQLKYKKHPEIGQILGKIYGYELHKAGVLTDIDLIIPVPLHPLKQKQRGYNQAMAFAEGLSEATGLPITEEGLVRTRYTETQTKKGKASRWQNVNEVFHVDPVPLLQGKHVLLVDDVVTTGATASVCAQKLLDAGSQKVSLAFIAAGR